VLKEKGQYRAKNAPMSMSNFGNTRLGGLGSRGDGETPANRGIKKCQNAGIKKVALALTTVTVSYSAGKITGKPC